MSMMSFMANGSKLVKGSEISARRTNVVFQLSVLILGKLFG